MASAYEGAGVRIDVNAVPSTADEPEANTHPQERREALLANLAPQKRQKLKEITQKRQGAAVLRMIADGAWIAD
eukprot:scaffold7226_cov387-Prasinococcus_capsulatus_cf.AAC.8